MSTGPNHRRGHGRIQDHGPAYESRTPAAGCNSTHVARSRAKWKKYKHRAERRTGGPASNFAYSGRGRPPAKEIDMADELGPTGEFPHGKIHESDEGELSIAVGHTPDGKVLMDFGVPTPWLGMEPDQAKEIAKALLHHADEAEKMRG